MTKAVRLVNALAILTALHVLGSSRLHAQAGLGHTEDASTPPKGVLRLRPIVSWTRYDARFSDVGAEQLGSILTSDSLGAANIGPLVQLQESISGLTQSSSYRLRLGSSRMTATSREELIPLAVDFGLTRRVAINLVVPVVRRRLATVFRLDSSGANVGPNLHRTSTTAAQRNALVQTEFTTAASQLQSRLTACQADPSGAGCSTILAQGPALLSESQLFASLVASVYGSSTQEGFAFVPRAASAEQTAIALRVADFNARYRGLLGADFIQTVPVGAGGPAGTADIQSFIVDDLRGDSLTPQERVGIGDVEVGVKARLIDRMATEERPYGLQLAAAAGARLPTGSTKRANAVEDLSLGTGTPMLNASVVLDASVRRFGLTSAVSGSFAFGSQPLAVQVPGFRGAGREIEWWEASARPRWHLSRVLSVHGAYSFRYAEAGATHLAGAGLSFMPLPTIPGDAPPIEMRFTHLEAIGGDSGMPKFFRDQLEVRAYLRLFR